MSFNVCIWHFRFCHDVAQLISFSVTTFRAVLLMQWEICKVKLLGAPCALHSRNDVPTVKHQLHIHITHNIPVLLFGFILGPK